MKLNRMLMILAASFPVASATDVKASETGSFSPSICAAYYLSLQNDLQLFAAMGGASPITIGPAADWAVRQLKASLPTEAAAAAQKLAIEINAAISADMTGNPATSKMYLVHLQPVVDKYDSGCRVLAHQEPIDLPALAQGKFPFVNLPPPVRVAPPSRLECAYYYHIVAMPFFVTARPDPKLLTIAGARSHGPKRRLRPPTRPPRSSAREKVERSIQELMAHAITNDLAIKYQPIVDYYDPACQSRRGHAAHRLKKFVFRLSHALTSGAYHSE